MSYNLEIYDSNYLNLREQGLYKADGAVTINYRESLKNQGISDGEIANFERLMKEEINSRRLFARSIEFTKTNLKERAIARANLDVEELLSQGYLNLDLLDEIEDIDSFEIDELF